MTRIHEPVRFGWRESGRHHQNCGTKVPDKAVANCREAWRRWSSPPGCGQLFRRNCSPRHGIRNICRDHHEISRRIVLVDVNEVLDHRERQMLSRVGETNTRTRPAPAKAICTLSVERTFRVRLAENSVNPRQLTPPYAIRPRTFSTLRAPSSVSIRSRGLGPPRARFGRFNHRVAVSSSPR